MNDVLLVGRNEALLHMLGGVLRSRGAQIRTAMDAEEVCIAIRLQPPDLVVYDHNRDEGFDLNPCLYGFRGGLLLLTNDRHSAASMTPRPDEVLSKPLALETLVERVLLRLGMQNGGSPPNGDKAAKE